MVNVRAELESFTWLRAKWTSDKLIACSPFRYDRTPSFEINLDESSDYYGCWTDWGANDPEYGRGGVVKLLAFLRNETLGETVEYVRGQYGADVDETDEPTLNLPEFTVDPPKRPPLREETLEDYTYRHPYLGGRGITEAVQRLMGIGYCRRRKALTIPWRDASGRLRNVKFRSVRDKLFWYYGEGGGTPIRELVFAMDIVYARNIRRAAIVEAEICAMTLMSVGIPAIAVGGAKLSEAQADIIRRSPIEELITCADRDAAGQRLERRIIEALEPYITIKVAGEHPYKDVNELAMAEGLPNVRSIVERARTVQPLVQLESRGFIIG